MECAHVPDHAPDVAPQAAGCQECLAIGSSWVHLRVCQTCGKVGCCDQSPHHHAHVHYNEDPDHVLIRSFEPGEAWFYCWADDFAFELAGVPPLKAAQ